MIVPFLKKNGKFSLYDTKNDKQDAIKIYGDKTNYSEIDSTEFDFIKPFKEGLAIASNDNKVFFIKPDGTILRTKQKYFQLRNFEMGLAAVCRDFIMGDLTYNFINKSGFEVNDISFDNYLYLKDGLIQVTINSGYAHDPDSGGPIAAEFSNGLMDCTGHLLIEPIKNATFYLHKKFIEVSCSSSIGSSSSYFDYSGNQIFDKKFGAFEYIGATLENRGIAILNDTKEYVIIDDDLNVIKNLCIKNQRDLGESYTIFEHLYGCHFFKGLCTIRKEGKWGMVNSEGNFVLNPNYDFVGAFTDYKSSTKDGFGCAIVGKIINSEMKYGAINSSLKEITRICFDKVGLFEEDIAKVKMNDKWGAINSEGNIVVPIEFNYILDCRDGLIEVGLGDYDSNRFVGHYGLYDKNGKKITKIIYERIGVFHNELAICRMYGKYGLLDKLGNEVIRCYYDGLDYFQNNVYKAKLDDSTFYIDSSGRKFK